MAANSSGAKGAVATIGIRDNNIVATLNGSESKLSFEELLKPVSRCIVLALVLVVSTGPLIRKLIAVTISDLAALTVGCLWFIGDLIPCVALMKVLHDSLLAHNRPLPIRHHQTGPNSSTDQFQLIDLIMVTFAVLYALDFIIFVSSSRTLLDNYRYAFFHIQILVSIIYMLTKCSKLDLRQLVLSFELFHTQALKVTHALQRLLNSSSRLGPTKAEQAPPSSKSTPVPASAPLAAKSAADRIEQSSSTRVSAIQQEEPPVLEPPDGPSEKGRRRPKSLSMVQRSTSSRQLLSEPAHATSAIRATVRRSRVAGRPRSRANSRSRGKQSIKQTIITMRSCGKTSKASKRHRCEPARTVNLNLNMS